MMKVAWVALALVGCSPKDASNGAPATGSATGAAGSGAAPTQPVAHAATCDLSGDYRVRYRSNGVDGWWLRFRVKDGKAELTANDAMDVFARGQLGLAQ